MKHLLTLLLFVLVSLPGLAQQDPLYAQYLTNPVVINPAYTGASDTWQTTIGYRTQWAGFDGNPTTLNFSSHLTAFENKVGLGLMVIQDRIGEIKNTEVNVMYSYRIEKDDKMFQFGLSTGLMNFRFDPSQLTLKDQNDPSFSFQSKSSFNTGFGFLVKSERFTAGLSVPRLLPSRVNEGGQMVQVYNQHMYLYGSYVFFLNERWRFKPAMLFKGTSGAPVSTDVNLNMVLDEKYSMGLLTRNLQSYGVLVQGRFKEYRFGYAFEIPTNRSVGQSFHSHEISLSWSIPVFRFHSNDIRNF